MIETFILEEIERRIRLNSDKYIEHLKNLSDEELQIELFNCRTNKEKARTK